MCKKYPKTTNIPTGVFTNYPIIFIYIEMLGRVNFYALWDR
jgi:hypothetical protein